MYALDYLNMIHLRAGLFNSYETAKAWIDEHDPERKSHYTIFEIPVNCDNRLHVEHNAPVSRYICQR